MVTRTGWTRVAVLGIFAGVFAGIPACASAPPPNVLAVGTQNLKCPRSEVETMLNRQTPKVSEYYVGCNFIFTRVHCTDTSCYVAKLKPPCIQGKHCFKEDPVTLDWVLEDETALADARSKR
jgi:hypothetical protein